MVYIIHVCFYILEFNQILDNLNDILVGKHVLVFIYIKMELTVDLKPTNATQIITFAREEQVLYSFMCYLFVWWFGVTQQTIYVGYRFLRIVRWILL